jgi:hypothetical protein
VAHVGLHAWVRSRFGWGWVTRARRGSRVQANGCSCTTGSRCWSCAMLMLAGGGDACTDIEYLRAQERLFGAVPSASSTYRAFQGIGPAVRSMISGRRWPPSAPRCGAARA